MAHPRNMPKQDLKAQYYSRRRSSMATTTSSSPTPASSSSQAPSSTSPLTAGQRLLMDKIQDRTVDALLERSKAVLQEWEMKKGIPTPTMKARTPATTEKEASKVRPNPAATSSPSLAPKLCAGAGHYREWDGKGKPVVFGMLTPEEGLEIGSEAMEKSERESLTAVMEDDTAIKLGRRMEVSDTISSSFTPASTSLQPSQEESPPLPSLPPPNPNPMVPAVPFPPAHLPVKEPQAANNTLVKLSAPTGALKEWKPKPKIHDWFCVSHRSSASTLDPYKCVRCTKRRAEAKSKSSSKK